MATPRSVRGVTRRELVAIAAAAPLVCTSNGEDVFDHLEKGTSRHERRHHHRRKLRRASADFTGPRTAARAARSRGTPEEEVVEAV